jgi:hypothetical protein
MDPLVNRAIQLLEKGDQSLRQICYKLTENSNLSWETLRTRVKRAMKQKKNMAIVCSRIWTSLSLLEFC